MDRPSPAAGRRVLAVILLVGLLVRLGWGLSRPANDAAFDLLPDQRGYLDAARNLLRGEGMWFVDERFDQRVYAVRTPGYPLFVALCGGSVRVVRAAQALIDTSTALAIFLLARRFTGGDRVAPALAAAAAVAFNPFLVYFSGLLLTETLYTSLLAWAMWLMVSARVWAAGVAPFFAGVALLVAGVYVRPSGIALPVLLAAATALVDARRPPRPPPRLVVQLLSPTLAALIVALITLAALVPWAARNGRVLGRWVWTTSNDGITAYDGFHAGATGASDQRFVARMPELRGMNELQRSDYLGAEAKRFARENPGRVAELTLAKTARTWSPVPLSDEFGRPLYRAIALMYSVPFDVLVIVGIVAGGLPPRVKLFLLLPALYFTAIHALSVGSLRYRIPVEPPLAVLAAVGAARVLGERRPTKAEGDTPRASPSES